jgi:hypothetical protein
MTCVRAQSECSRNGDERLPLSPQVERHLETCDDCADFRRTTLAIERGYRKHVLSGIDRLRRLDAPVLPTRKPSRALRWIPLAAAVLIGAWGMVRGTSPVATPAALAPAAEKRSPPSRSLLLGEAGLFKDGGLELTTLSLREPLLPVRLDQDLPRVLAPDPEIALPRNLRF